MQAILAEIAQLLYQRIEHETDRDILIELGDIAQRLEPVFADAGFAGGGREFFLWAGLKLDAPEMGEAYGPGIVQGFPELFDSGE